MTPEWADWLINRTLLEPIGNIAPVEFQVADDDGVDASAVPSPLTSPIATALPMLAKSERARYAVDHANSSSWYSGSRGLAGIVLRMRRLQEGAGSRSKEPPDP